jgi:hypothetical protein
VLCAVQNGTGECVLCAVHNFSQVQYKLSDDGRRPKYIGAIFVVHFNVNFKPFPVSYIVNLLVNELYIYISECAEQRQKFTNN